MNSICFLMPYFGRWPEWINLYLQSCARNPTIDWIFFTDCGVPVSPPINTRFIDVEWSQFARAVKDICRIKSAPRKPYKLCDFRFAFGEILKTYLHGYDFWGFGDMDVIYGDLRSFLTSDVLAHDLLTFQVNHISGHLTLVRNTDEIAAKYKSYEPWLIQANNPQYVFLDENIGYYDIANVYAIESYSTPLSPYIPWTDGRFRFPYEWYYLDGRLYNNIDGDKEFMYLHFMRYKFYWRTNKIKSVLHFNPDIPPAQWKLAMDGFYPYSQGDEKRKIGEFLPPYEPPSPRPLRPFSLINKVWSIIR